MQPDPLASSSAMLPLFTANEAEQAVSVLFALLFIVWTIYTLVTTYHWIRYGHKSAVAIPALITHVAVSAYLALYAISGLSR